MTPDTPIEIDCQSVRAKLSAGDDCLLLDCRESEEHAIANIPGARLLAMSELASRLGELEPYRQREIVVHCHHGGRSLKVALWLRDQGYAQARSMAGGIERWSLEVDPAVPRY